MINILGNSRLFFRLTKSLSDKKISVKRKICKQSNGTYTITIPPIIINEIVNGANTEYVELSIETILDNDIIAIKPYIETENKNKKE